eukprot:CAMPEP_0201524286 /NCGR_PEP_ID=MMETSP0161_2-20130828/21227_1 /ASSEMBLY_ACC=CAM_ASM_000251 /TAXON_ID=180227 /ORGANISM="Neoparamoeba aestuarina, Strain SoJaBio B1-5/56/2" /LENGTH=101 /DNA_ID=CAMNT_0047923599 /DNA_START=25 /DNA_END=330 /DNA_ORIENTATION=-
MNADLQISYLVCLYHKMGCFIAVLLEQMAPKSLLKVVIEQYLHQKMRISQLDPSIQYGLLFTIIGIIPWLALHVIYSIYKKNLGGNLKKPRALNKKRTKTA